MAESLKSRATRFLFNLFPCYRRTGVKVIYISPDFQEVRIKLPLNWKTKEYNGTTAAYFLMKRREAGRGESAPSADSATFCDLSRPCREWISWNKTRLVVGAIR